MRAVDLWLPVALAVAFASASVGAQGKAEHDRRVATDLAQLFGSLDRDGDRSVTRVEAAGDVNFLPRFADMDINRDGVVTSEELNRYLVLQYGVNLDTVAAPPSVAPTPAKPPAASPAR